MEDSTTNKIFKNFLTVLHIVIANGCKMVTHTET